MTGAALLAAAVLVGVNAWFVTWEFALVAAQRSKLEALAEEGSRRAAMALNALARRSRRLVGAQLAVTVASLALGVLTEPAVAPLVEPLVELFGDPSDGVVRAVSLAGAFALVTLLHMVFGEMVPKGLALAGPERAVLFLAPFNNVFGAVFRPVIWFVDGLAKSVAKLVGLERLREIGTVHTTAEFVAMLDASREGGMLEASEHSLLAGALDFRSRAAAAVMVPRSEVLYVNRRMTVASIERVAHRSGHSRLPVVGTGLDNVIGFLHVKDLLRLPPEARDEPVPLELIRRMLVVPGDRPLEALLRAMRRARSHVALVRGDAGRTLGIVTLEDVLEALVGEIADESDRDVPPGTATRRRG